jgi:hypothetical protein
MKSSAVVVTYGRSGESAEGRNLTTRKAFSEMEGPSMPGFADTAAYFEARAKKARAREDQERFLETAGFYRALSRITPGFPPGYKTPQLKLSRSTKAARWRARAEECRAISEATQDQNCRAMLSRLAESYDGMANCYSE